MNRLLHLRFYNCAPPSPERGSTRLARELEAIVDDKPVLVGLAETIGYSLPELRGYTKIRDTSTPGRANVAVYLRTDHQASRVTWFDMHQTWPRTDHPGTHPARAWVELRFDGGVQALVGHQGPKLPPRAGGAETTRRVQQEGIAFLTRRLAPWLRDDWPARSEKQKARSLHRPRIVLADWNRGPLEDGPGQRDLARTINAVAVGTHIDGAVVRGATVTGAHYANVFEGVRLGTDHPWGALRLEVVPMDAWHR